MLLCYNYAMGETAGISFFIAEEHSLTNLGVRDFLASKDFTCLGSARSCSEALEKLSCLALEGSLPDILLLGLSLDGSSGLDLIKEASKLYPAVKIIVYSMYESSGLVALAIEYGAHGYVCKDSDEKELCFAIKSVYEGKSYIQSALISPLLRYYNMLSDLTKKEAAVVKKIVENKGNRQIAEELSISLRTVENYLSRIYEKTGCHSHEDLAAKFGGGTNN